MNIPEVRSELNKLAASRLNLTHRVPCPMSADQEAGTMCYAVGYDADEFGKRIDALDHQGLRPLTGWRDD